MGCRTGVVGGLGLYEDWDYTRTGVVYTGAASAYQLNKVIRVIRVIRVISVPNIKVIMIKKVQQSNTKLRTV
jgi:phage shock protein PspC (stress-responsive transcriptional regulator)